VPASRISAKRSRQKSGASRRLMKPGPATSTASTASAERRASASGSAIARGAIPAALASTMAALVARSPWLGSRGGSTPTRVRSSPAGNWPAPANSSSFSITISRNDLKKFIYFFNL
jgi:hypothetical protein